MSKTSTVRARIEPEVKEKAEKLFKRLGFTTTQAITMFYKQVIMRKGLPFDVVIPNTTTLNTFEDTDSGKNLVIAKDADDMFKKLSI